MFVDNAATVQTSKLKEQILNNNRRIDTRFFKICDHVEAGEITILWCPGTINPADLFTKPLTNQRLYLMLTSCFRASLLSRGHGGCKGFNQPLAAAGAKRARKALKSGNPRENQSNA